MFADSPNDRIDPSSPVGTFATRLLAQALKYYGRKQKPVMMIGADHYIPGSSIGARARNRYTSDSSISGAPSVGRAPNLRARVRVASLLQGVAAPVQKEVRAAYCARVGINLGRRFITRTLCLHPRGTPIHLPFYGLPRSS